MLAINGDERSAIVGASYWRNVRGGATYRVDVERRGERMSVELPLPLGPGRPFDNFGLAKVRDAGTSGVTESFPHWRVAKASAHTTA